MTGLDAEDLALDASLTGPPASLDGLADAFGGYTPVRGVTNTIQPGVTGNFTNQDINGILNGTAWNTTAITYSFPTSGSYYGSAYGSGEPFRSFQAASAQQQAVARYAFSLISQYTNLTFVETTESASVHATIRLANSSAPATSWAYYPANWAEAGDVWLGQAASLNPIKAGYDFDTILHEIGHAVGLKHGMTDDGVHGVLPDSHNSTSWSIMTYLSYLGEQQPYYYTNAAGSGPQTYMADDIAALQYIYGANFNTNSGSTTYSWDTNTGQMFINGVGQGASSANKVYETIWDGNGADTYDLSNYATAVNIDLRPGQWSTFSTGQLADLDVLHPGAHMAPGNILNADLYYGDTRSLIENAKGGGGSDVLTGNAGANALDGGGGNDTLIGLGGADTLTGGGGADTFVFAPGQAGNAVITDFSIGQGDKLDLTAFTTIHSLGSLLAHATLSGSDILITFDSGSVTLSNVAAASLTRGQFLFSPGSTPVPPADFNGDGVSDILLRDSTTGAFGYMALTPLGGSSWHAVGGSDASYGVFAVADFNGDGASDMLLRNDTTGDVGFMDLTPGGGPVWHDIGGSAVSYTVQGTGDFNGDHVTDMLWRNNNSGDVGYTALTSSGGASWVHLGNSSTAYTVEGTGDFNGDGVSDLLFRNDSTGDVGYTALTPSGGARWVYLGGSATAYAVQGSGDFNGDGVSDLLFRNQTTGDYGYTALTPSGGASWHALGVSDPTYAIVATGDFNGDGMADVLQRNNATGDYGYMATTLSTGVWHDIGVTDAAHFII
jgi:Ca2+-binding RTX toxin-like protein